jgi:hypothetical protein
MLRSDPGGESSIGSRQAKLFSLGPARDLRALLRRP